MVDREWSYETAPDLDQTLITRLENFPRQPDILVYSLRSMAALLLRGFLRGYHRLDVSGRNKLPRDEAFVMVANHQSHLDALCLLSALPLRQLHQAFPAAAEDYFFKSIPRLTIAAIVVNALPFARNMRGKQSLELCRAILRNPGNVLILFPEGTRSTTGELGSFKRGIGSILAGVDIPVVPCNITGAHHAWPKGKLFPRPRKLQLTIGDPLRFGDREASKESSREIAEELRLAVAALSSAPAAAPDAPA